MPESNSISDTAAGVASPVNIRIGSNGEHIIDISISPDLSEFLVSQKPISIAVDSAWSNLLMSGMVKIIYHSQQMAPCRDGVRRSKTVWVSNTAAKRAESVKRFRELFPFATRDSTTMDRSTYLLKFGCDVECIVLFRVYKSYVEISDVPNASFYVFNEFSSIRKDVFMSGSVRAGNYPSYPISAVGCVTDNGESNKRVWGISRRLPAANSFWNEVMKGDFGDVHVTTLR